MTINYLFKLKVFVKLAFKTRKEIKPMFSLAIVNYLHSQMEKKNSFLQDIFVFTLCTRTPKSTKTSLSTDLVILYIIVFYFGIMYGKLDWLCCGKNSLQVGHKYCHSIKSFTLLVM